MENLTTDHGDGSTAIIDVRQGFELITYHQARAAKFQRRADRILSNEGLITLTFGVAALYGGLLRVKQGQHSELANYIEHQLAIEAPELTDEVQGYLDVPPPPEGRERV